MLKAILSILTFVLLFFHSTIAKAALYECEVSEDQSQQVLGSMLVDTESEDVYLVAIDAFMFAACTGAQEPTVGDLLLCAYVIDDGTLLSQSQRDGEALKIARSHLDKDLALSALKAETRSMAITALKSPFLLHTFMRNSRLFQTVCLAQ